MVIPLLFVSQSFIRVWAGVDVVPSWHLVLLMGLWAVINAFCSPIAGLFAASNHLRAQVVYAPVSALLNLVLSIHLVTP